MIGRLGGVHLDRDIVDAAAVQGAQHMLDRVDLGVADLDGGGAHQVGHLVDPGPEFRLAVQVRALENDAVAGRRGLHRQGDDVAGVQRIAFDRDLARQGALFHGISSPLCQATSPFRPGPGRCRRRC
jgi:hypothetical protein